MNYNLIGENDFQDPIIQIMKNRGIDNFPAYINIDNKSVHSHKLLHNIDKAVEKLLEHVKSPIAISIDPDVDGLTSSSQLGLGLKRHFPDIDLRFILPNGKQHDTNLEDVPDDVKLLITPDAGTNSFALHRALKEKGIDVLVIDHHEANRGESPHATVLNNQLSPFYPNKTLTGAGMVNKFLHALDEHFNTNYADDYLDLVALGLIADMASMKNDETRFLIWQGLKRDKNAMVKAFWEDLKYSSGGARNPKEISFGVAPKINATVRLGNKEDIERIFQGFMEKDEINEYKYQGSMRTRSFQKFAISKAGSLHTKQKNLKSKEGAKLIEQIKLEKGDAYPIIIAHGNDKIPKTMNGLIAMDLVTEFKRPAMLLQYNAEKQEYSGSVRGYDGVTKDFKSYLLGTGLMKYAAGHPNAFGVAFKEEYLPALLEKVTTDFEAIEGESTTDVDFVFDGESPDFDFINLIDRSGELFGRDVNSPIIAIDNLAVQSSDFVISSSKKQVTLAKDGCTYAFYTNKMGNLEEFHNKMTSSGKLLSVRIVGESSINRFRGEVKPTVVVNDIEIVEVLNELPKKQLSGVELLKADLSSLPF